MSCPDFIIIGAMKCGTSTLATQLGQQNGLFLTTPKEPNFFSDDDVFARGLHWYASLFERAGTQDIKGEASTHYTKLPTHPHTVTRMRAVLANPRLVYMVRDPVQRSVSHFIHEWSERRMSGNLDSALETYPELVEYSLYAKQIAPFIDAYGIDAICLTSLERLKTNPADELARIAHHIGFKGPTQWHSELSTQNVSAERVRKLPLHNLLVDNPVARSLRRALVPQSLRTRLAKSRQMHARPTLSPDRIAALRAQFASDQTRLSELFPDVIETDMKREVS
ncbi:MAG: sulfotransferase domain-containing protein [Tateyamaria sp.]|uniref:sulfotransferase domain-containing protein n=1 Tax=Tateyamaria sp. TaxID=1929288 RepID=UPI003282C8A0